MGCGGGEEGDIVCWFALLLYLETGFDTVEIWAVSNYWVEKGVWSCMTISGTGSELVGMWEGYTHISRGYTNALAITAPVAPATASPQGGMVSLVPDITIYVYTNLLVQIPRIVLPILLEHASSRG